MADDGLKRALRETNVELLRRVEDLSFVRTVGDAMAGVVSPAAIGQSLVCALREELSVDLVGLWVVDDLAGGLARMALVQGDGPYEAAADPEHPPLIPFGNQVFDAALQAAVRIAAPEAAVQVSDLAGAAAVYLTPITARGRTLAVLAIGADVPIDADVERRVGLIAPTVAMALENAGLYERLARENHTLRVELTHRFGTQAIIGVSAALRRLREAIDRLATTDITVLVLGESGTGKEMVARALHYGGRRAPGPFVALNCAALPETLLESELFGIERGVATGVERRAGMVERAHGGTLFLDEIGDMHPAVQAKVLRVLQEREVVRVGGARPTPVDVRVVAATHRDLDAAVRDGTFRQDLYYRLKVATVTVPSLADRREDVPVLAQHFLARFGEQHGRPGLRFASDALASLWNRPWAGNVRELANVVEQAVVMAAGAVITPSDLASDLGGVAAAHGELRRVVDVATEEAERQAIERTLDSVGRNRTRAAALLGIGRRTLLYKLKRYGIR
jgi:transcriptional regulator with PAS, ATPase and Fis domain